MPSWSGTRPLTPPKELIGQRGNVGPLQPTRRLRAEQRSSNDPENVGKTTVNLTLKPVRKGCLEFKIQQV